MTDETDEPGLDPRLLEMLICPVTRGMLKYDRNRNELISEKAGLAFPIHNGIPVMLAEEARPLDK
ncbi:MAG: Trm112 family protein [Rhodospirillales bacterium]|nr:Trm112 family protein [Rhodospirillales bacterium]MDE2390569.1 Trm112 family protein [Rhodospirillales bacterium]